MDSRRPLPRSAALAAFLLAVMCIAPAQAAPPGGVGAIERAAGAGPIVVARDGRVAPHVVIGRLQAQGFYGFETVRYRPRRNRYVVRAYDPDGRFVRIAADARTGDVLNVRPLDAGGWGGGWRSGWGW